MRTSTTDDPYLTYYSAPDTGISSTRHQDGRPGPKERVVGVRLGGDVKAYAFNALQRERVVNDEVGSTPVVLVFDGRSESGAVYRRELKGALLIFQPTRTALQMRDRDTGSTWDGITGRAFDGPLVGLAGSGPHHVQLLVRLGRLLSPDEPLQVRPRSGT